MSNKINVIDARGLSCPQPVLMTKKALDKKSTPSEDYEIIVDNATAKENVTRFAENSGYNVKVNQSGEDFHLVIRK